MTAKLRPEQVNLLRLIERSPRDADGWSKVSARLITPVMHWAEGLEKLIDTDIAGSRVRLTRDAAVVLEWLL